MFSIATLTDHILFYFFSSACIPVTLNCLEKNHKVDSRVTQFVLPIGTTVNKDGTAIYIAVSAIYIVKIYHGDTLNLSSAVLIW